VQAAVAVPDPDTVRKYGDTPEQIPLRKVAGLTLDHLTDGFAIDSKAEIAEAEELLPERSGEPACQVYSRINRSLCRPAVHLLSDSRITPNAVALAAFAAAVISAVMFARGTYSSCVIGALLFFLSGLLDELSSMLAWVTFRESSLGIRTKGLLETLTCSIVLGGIMIGLYSHCRVSEIVGGGVLMIGCLVPLIVIAIQGRTATDADQPQTQDVSRNESSRKHSSSRFLTVAQRLRILSRKGVAIHFLLLFTISGGLPLFLWLTALGSNVSWVLTLYLKRRVFQKPSTRSDVEAIRTDVEPIQIAAWDQAVIRIPFSHRERADVDHHAVPIGPRSHT
jgi:hypothetical protein